MNSLSAIKKKKSGNAALCSKISNSNWLDYHHRILNSSYRPHSQFMRLRVFYMAE